MPLALGLGLGVSFVSNAPSVPSELAKSAELASLVVQGLIIPERKVQDGVLLRSTSTIWFELVRVIGSDWAKVHSIPSERMEELVAGAFELEGYEVILTPRSGDHGRDVIATKHGVGSVKILGSVKAYAPHRIVPYDEIRALLGVVTLDPAASKGIITTTSDFPPLIDKDPLAQAIPTRLELMNGEALQKWLGRLSAETSTPPTR